MGPYRLERLLGFGGMGEVHLAYDTVRERTVALKLLSEALSKDADYQRRFRRESHVAARLREPHVIPIHDYGEVDGQLFIDMRLVDGQNVREILSNGGAMPAERAVHLVGQVADALEAAHADGLVHRDIKPSNVLVTANDFVYVVDFGIARSVGTARSSMTLTGVTVGTLDYMAPERFSRSDIDGRADVYSLACLLFECLTGTPPFVGDDLPSLMYAHLFDDPPRPSALVASLPVAMDAVIATGMAKGLDDRFSSPVELADAARAALGGTAAAVRRPTGGSTLAGSEDAGDRPVAVGAHGDVPASGSPGSGSTEKPGVEKPGVGKPGAEKSGAEKSGAEKSGAGSAGSVEQAPGAPAPATAARASGAHRSAAPASAAPESGPAGSAAAGSAAVATGATAAAASAAPGAAESPGQVTSANDLLGALGAVHVPGGSPLAADADPAFQPTAKPKPVAPPARAVAEPEPVTARVALDRTPAQAPTHVTPAPAAQDGPTVMFATPAAPPARPARPAVREPEVRTPSRRRGPLLTVAAVLVVAALVVGAGYLIGSGASAPVATPPANPLAVPPADDHDPAAAVSIAVPTVRGSITVGPTPGYMEIAPNGRFAYIANRDAGVVTVLDTAINRVTSAIPIEAGPPQFVAFSPDGLRAYVSIYNTERTVNLVGVLDTTTNTVLTTIPVGRRPFASATTPDGSRLYVPSHDDGRLDVIDTATSTVVAEIPVAPNPHWVAFAPDGSRLYAANHESNLVSVIDPADNSVVATIPVGTSPHSTTLSPDGTRVAVVNFDSSEVSVIDTATNTVVATVPVGLKPQDIAYSTDGRFLYTANVDADTISVIDTGTDRVTAVIPAGDGPTSVAVSRDGRTAYVTILNDGSVLMLDLTAS